MVVHRKSLIGRLQFIIFMHCMFQPNWITTEIYIRMLVLKVRHITYDILIMSTNELCCELAGKNMV